MDTEIAYQDDKIRIEYYPKADGHILILGKQILFIPRGTLEELARTPITKLKDKISAIDPNFDPALQKYASTYERVGLAISQARVKELEEELRDSHQHTS